MTTIERLWQASLTRRKALAGLASMLAASPLLHAQPDPRPFSSHRRAPGINEILTAFDFEPVMFANVPQTVYDYTAHGDGSEWSVLRNRQAFDWVDLVTDNAVDPAKVDLSSQLLGLNLKYPVMIAPTATQVPLHPEGEAGMYSAAALAANTPLCLSANSSQTVEEVATDAQGQLWWQFYPQRDLGVSQELIERAQTAGSKGLVITVDQQASYYERSQHNRNLGGRAGGAARPAIANQATRQGAARYGVGVNRLWYTWEYMDQVRNFSTVPVIIKGIVTPEDARICVEHGFDAVVVSNHGGRSMDYGPSTLEVLPEIVAAVNGAIPVMIDSGFRSGSDILKALALGADAVWLGRTTRWALGAYGPAGVQKLLEDIIYKELVDATAAAGRTTLASIDASIVRQTWP